MMKHWHPALNHEMSRNDTFVQYKRFLCLLHIAKLLFSFLFFLSCHFCDCLNNRSGWFLSLDRTLSKGVNKTFHDQDYSQRLCKLLCNVLNWVENIVDIIAFSLIARFSPVLHFSHDDAIFQENIRTQSLQQYLVYRTFYTCPFVHFGINLVSNWVDWL